MKFAWHFSTTSCVPDAPTGKFSILSIDADRDPGLFVGLVEIRLCTRTFTLTSLCRETAIRPGFAPDQWQRLLWRGHVSWADGTLVLD